MIRNPRVLEICGSFQIQISSISHIFMKIPLDLIFEMI